MAGPSSGRAYRRRFDLHAWEGILELLTLNIPDSLLLNLLSIDSGDCLR